MNEIIDAIVELMTAHADIEGGWMRTEDISRALGCSKKATIRYLYMLKDNGQLEVGRVIIDSIDNKRVPVSAYRLRGNDGEAKTTKEGRGESTEGD